MEEKEFTEFFLRTQENERNLMLRKGDEYAAKGDRFSNFKNGQYLQVPGNTPEGCAWNYMSKHLEAAMAGLKDLSEGTHRPLSFWREKLGDIRLYCSLIEGMLEERKGLPLSERTD